MSFVYPPPAPAENPSANSPSFGIGSSLAISWTNTTSTYSNATLVLMKNDGNHTCTLLNLGLAYCEAIQLGAPFMARNLMYPCISASFSAYDSHGISWRVSTYAYPEYPADTNPSYYLILAAFDTTGVVSKFYSHDFFIYPPDDVPTTTYTGSTPPTTTSNTASSSTASSTIASSTTTASSSISSSATSAAIALTTSAPSPGLNGSDKIAIGVAVGLGLPLIIALAIIAFFLFKKRRKNSPASAPANPRNYQDSKSFAASSHNIGEDWATTGTPAPSELGSRPIPTHQAHGWQPQQQQQPPVVSPFHDAGESYLEAVASRPFLSWLDETSKT
ncbi:uncharacterized protein A1O5_05321 [Cladophialophora psammophila CBS 110553]|uniref:Mid2 domain-containing protein n=1 Tax=Cladophialophora psammophila CBS 110553 TaxID=1182543 RepID=W9WU89_9EURO|nr:uncharacterized protein A1O5_05321 [Cladophialophora psammophila CBS 110553]EXJ71513.1 hypothetical protein A1O5_05321 [Cladophialophora psammophila CBS 110553]